MKVFGSFLVLFFFSSLVLGQKVVRKILTNPDTRFIQVDTKNCYEVKFHTADSQELRVKAFIEGEYAKDLVVRIEEDGQNVFLSTDFLPNFIAPNDKLSAHKVISIKLDIIIPEYSNVTIYGTNTNVTGSGKYRNLKVTLAEGDCILQDVSETVEVKTQKGNIHVITPAGMIDARSAYGMVEIADLPKGNFSYSLKSIEGNIVVSNPK